MTNNENEKWKVIPDFPRYCISSKGRVMSYTSKSNPNGKLMTIVTNPNGYKVLNLKEGTERGKNKSKSVFVHKLMAEAFIPLPPNLRRKGKKQLEVDHIIPISNGGTCTIDNLRWVTREMNMQNEYTVQNVKRARQESSKPVYVYNEELQLLSAFTSTADASRQLNKSQGNISNCASGSLKRYLGYIFSYIQLDNIKQREEVEEERKEQRQRNMANCAAAARRWIKSHPEKFNEHCRNYYHRREGAAEKQKERVRKYYQLHKEEIAQKRREKRIQDIGSQKTFGT